MTQEDVTQIQREDPEFKLQVTLYKTKNEQNQLKNEF